MKSLLILSALIASTSAAAQPVEVIADAPRIERVAFVDLDLTSDAGFRRLEARIQSAANRLCIENGVQPLAVVLAGKSCRNQAITGAADQVQMAISRFGNSQYSALSQIAVSLRSR
jgi:UrcA family protein